jgi:hypothetical protein
MSVKSEKDELMALETRKVKALEKAKELKKQALDSYLASQNIRQLYMLDVEEEEFDNL